MAVGLDHPDVVRFMARLEGAAAVLPPQRREELVGEIGEHLREALAGGAGDAQVRSVLDRLGEPEDIVAAEADGAPRVPAPAPAPYVAGPPSPWGPLEIGAVLLLTVGLVVLPVVGPLVGIVLAWVSPRWTRREKTVATLWMVLPAVLLVVLALAGLLLAVPVHVTGNAPDPVSSAIPVTP